MPESIEHERFRRSGELFDAALDLEPAARAAWLREACAGDGVLEAQVLALLAAHDRAAGVLELSPALPATAAGPAPDDATPDPSGVGPYRLLREVGRGGMGTVYLADRADGQFRQRVAVKLLRRGLDTDDVVARFLGERQILASLDHPNIARLLDGGVAEDGRPYLVMPYVDGIPIDAYCDQHRLPLEERVALFQVVARAVQHAHRNLIVHRDLKPGNILVTAEGQVVLVDFGIAKLLDPAALPGPVPATRTGYRIMTPKYASPEQAVGDPVTTATDVYALGLVLYELLTGRFPYDLEGAALAEVERIVAHVDPARPGAVVRGDDHAIAEARRLTPQRLRRRLGGDLERILLTALRKEPERRYASADALADDLENWLQGEPVAARGQSASYRLRRFARRHRWAVAAAVGFAVLITGYAVTVTVQSRRVRLALDSAERSAAEAQQVSAFLVNLFEASDPGSTRGDTVTARELLARGEARADALRSEPAAQALLLDVIGRVYQRLGDPARAQPLIERALEVRRAALGPDDPAVGSSLRSLGVLLKERGDYPGGAARLAEAAAIHRATLGPAHQEVIRDLAELGAALSAAGEYDSAEAVVRNAQAALATAAAPDTALLAALADNLGGIRLSRGDVAGAEAPLRQALALRQRLYGKDHPDVASTVNTLAGVHFMREQFGAAESLFVEAAAIARRLYGPDHPAVAGPLQNAATVRTRLGRLEEAAATYEEVLRIERLTRGPEHVDLAWPLAGLGVVAQRRGDFRRADSLLQEALRIRLRAHGGHHRDVAVTYTLLGRLAVARGDRAAAADYFTRSFMIQEPMLGRDNPEIDKLRRALDSLGAPPASPARVGETGTAVRP